MNRAHFTRTRSSRPQLGAVALCGILACAFARAETTVHLNGLTHSDVAGTHVIYSGAGTFDAHDGSELVVRVDRVFFDAGPGDQLTIQVRPPFVNRINLVVAMPAGGEFKPGVYGGAVGRQPLPNAGTLTASRIGRSCHDEAGWIIVHEAQFDGAGEAEKLAVDFVHYCESSRAPLFAAVRINSSIPPVRDQPYAVAGRPRKAAAGDPVMLSAQDSFSYSASPLQYAWAQVSGPTVALDGARSARVRFTAPDVPPGGANVRLRLTVTDAAHREDIDEVDVFVHHQEDVQTRAMVHFRNGNGIFPTLDHLFGRDPQTLAPRDYVMRFDDLDWSFSTAREAGTYGADFTWQGRIRPRLELDSQLTTLYADFNATFHAPLNAPPSNEIYYDAVRMGDQFVNPWIAFSGLGTGCGKPVGAFQIHELELAPRQDPYTPAHIIRAAVDFVQFCVRFGVEVLPPITGSIRINSSLPLNDGIVPPLPAAEPMNLQFSITPSQARINETVTFRWHATNASYCFIENLALSPFAGALPPSGIATTSFPVAVQDQQVHLYCMASNNAYTVHRDFDVMPSDWVGGGGGSGGGGTPPPSEPRPSGGGGATGFGGLLMLLASAIAARTAQARPTRRLSRSRPLRRGQRVRPAPAGG